MSQTKDNKIRNVKIDQKKIKEIAEEKVSEYEGFVSELMVRVADKQVYDLTPAEKRDIKKYVVRHDARLEQIKETSAEYQQTAVLEKEKIICRVPT